MPRAIEQRRVTAAEGMQLNLVRFRGSGSARPLLFVHGSFGHARVWDFVVDALPEEISAWAVDLPGHGDSDRATGPEGYDLDRLVEYLRPVVATVDGLPVLVGHSVGNAAAMFYAARYPETLAAAVFIDIDPHPPDYHAEHLNRVGAAPPKRYDAFERAVARERRIVPKAPRGVAEHLATHGYHRTAQGWEQGFDQAFLRAARTWDALPILGKIRIPALVLRGEESIVMSEEGYRQMLEGLPDVRGEEVAGAGHQLHLERPEAVARAIGRFVTALEA